MDEEDKAFKQKAEGEAEETRGAKSKGRGERPPGLPGGIKKSGKK